jgi:hypothetical protein
MAGEQLQVDPDKRVCVATLAKPVREETVRPSLLRVPVAFAGVVSPRDAGMGLVRLPERREGAFRETHEALTRCLCLDQQLEGFARLLVAAAASQADGFRRIR